MTLPEMVTYVIAPILAGLTAVWALVKIVVPRMVEARLEEQRDTREHTQSLQRLEQAYHLSEGAVAQQMIAEILANSQEAKERADEYVRKDIKEAVDRIAAHVSHMPDLRTDVQKIKYELRNLSTEIRLLSDIIKNDDIRLPDKTSNQGGANE